MACGGRKPINHTPPKKRNACLMQVFLVSQLHPALHDPGYCGPPGSPQSKGTSKQEHGRWVPFPSPWNQTHISRMPLTLAGKFLTAEVPGKPLPDAGEILKA